MITTENGTRRWVSIKAAADYLSIHRATVHAWINNRGLPAHGIAGARRLDLNEIDAWMTSDKR